MSTRDQQVAQEIAKRSSEALADAEIALARAVEHTTNLSNYLRMHFSSTGIPPDVVALLLQYAITTEGQSRLQVLNNPVVSDHDRDFVQLGLARAGNLYMGQASGIVHAWSKSVDTDDTKC